VKKTIATCDCCPSPATEEVNLEGGHTLDFCDACVLSPGAMQRVLKVSKEIRAQRAHMLYPQQAGSFQQGWQR
jgi:hypothetical protein